MLVEMWKQVPFAPRYLASSFGNVLGLRTRLMAPTETDRGYLVLDLHKVQYRLNRVICTTFHGEAPSDEHHAAHKDNNKRNNREDNLYWATPQENADDLTASEVNKGIMHFRAMFTEDEVRYIRGEFDKGYSVAALVREFPGSNYSTIDHIARRISYKDLK